MLANGTTRQATRHVASSGVEFQATVPSGPTGKGHATGNRRGIWHSFFRAGFSFSTANRLLMTTSDKIPVTPRLDRSSGRMLIAVARVAGQPESFVTYRPAIWFEESPTVCRRTRWSRTLRRLERCGLVIRQVDRSRNRVRKVAVTEMGWQWVIENCGPGAVLPLESL